jgi:hypothetical protein
MSRDRALKPATTGDDPRFAARLARVVKPDHGRRAAYRLLLLLSLVPAAIIVVVTLWREPGVTQVDPALRPLEFAVVQKRSAQVFMWQTHKQVVQLLGPPTERFANDPELREAAVVLNNGGKNFMPTNGAWDRWRDPQDASRWVAILYDASSPKGTVYWKLQNGF